MQLRDVERREVVEVGLDFGAVIHRVAHRDEDVLDALSQESYRVEVAAPRPSSGQSNVEPLVLGLERVDAARERDGNVAERAAYLFVELLDDLAEARALLRGDAPHELHQLRDG